MKRQLSNVFGGVLAFVGLVGWPGQACRADEIHFDGGYVRLGRRAAAPADAPPARYESPPPPAQLDYFYPRYQPAPRPAGAVRGVPATALPWNRVGFAGYDESAQVAGGVRRAAEKYSLESAAVPHAGAAAGDRVLLIAHLPEDAELWVEGQRTSSQGRTRSFESPPLAPGGTYRYALRAVWREDGRWVSQDREVTVSPGLAHAVYLTLSPAGLARKRVDTNLAKLSPEDQQVARLQKLCVVRGSAQLGEHGVPIKVMVKGHRVFVATPDDVARALADPDKTWELAQSFRVKHAKEGGEK